LKACIALPVGIDRDAAFLVCRAIQLWYCFALTFYLDNKALPGIAHLPRRVRALLGARQREDNRDV
jgi:hypothetical protein